MGLQATQIKSGMAATSSASQVSVRPAPNAPTPLPIAQDPPPLLEKVRTAIKANGGADGIAIAALNPLLHRQGIRITDTPERTWRAWLMARPQHFACDPKGPDAKVRLLR
ncbi:hypothetical protein [Paragemmobacter ruber]|nr:hypothetical protein [Rhodobacter ruber]